MAGADGLLAGGGLTGLPAKLPGHGLRARLEARRTQGGSWHNRANLARSVAFSATCKSTVIPTFPPICGGLLRARWAIRRRSLTRPVIGIADTHSGFNNCHRHFPELIEAVKRGVLAAGGLPLEFPDDLARRGLPAPDQPDVPQSDGDGHRGDDPRPADGCGRAGRRLRQDRAGAADGRDLGQPAGHRAGRRADDDLALARRAARRLHRLPPLLGQVPRRRDRCRGDRRGRGQSRDDRRHLRGDGHGQHDGLDRRGARHDPARQRGDPGGPRRPAARRRGDRPRRDAARRRRAHAGPDRHAASRSRTRCAC